MTKASGAVGGEGDHCGEGRRGLSGRLEGLYEPLRAQGIVLVPASLGPPSVESFGQTL